jgi:hypothetical protein
MRPPTRRFKGFSLLRLGQVSGTAAVALVAVFIETCATAPAKPDNIFTSNRYGYSVVVSTGWSMYQAPGEWAPDTQPGVGNPGVDAFSNQTLDQRILVVATPVADGTALEGWAKNVALITPPQCSTDSSVSSTLGGERAQLWDIHCDDGAQVFKVAAVHRGRGYLLAFLSLAKFEIADRNLFASVIRSFTFTG